MATEKKERSVNNKDERIYVRLNQHLKRDFEMLARFRGLTPSAMLHSYVVRSVNEERRENPDLFFGESLEKPQPVERKALSLSEKLLAAKAENSGEYEHNNTFTTGDGETIPLVEEWAEKK